MSSLPSSSSRKPKRATALLRRGGAVGVPKGRTNQHLTAEERAMRDAPAVSDWRVHPPILGAKVEPYDDSAELDPKSKAKRKP